jgi:hypothetical protein
LLGVRDMPAASIDGSRLAPCLIGLIMASSNDHEGGKLEASATSRQKASSPLKRDQLRCLKEVVRLVCPGIIYNLPLIAPSALFPFS